MQLDMSTSVRISLVPLSPPPHGRVVPAEDDFAQESLHISCYGKRAAPRNAQFKIDRDVELIET
jgi:hypothetical protein